MIFNYFNDNSISQNCTKIWYLVQICSLKYAVKFQQNAGETEDVLVENYFMPLHIVQIGW